MDATDSIDPGGLAKGANDAAEDSWSVQTDKARRRLHVSGAASRLSLTSHLGPNEPETEAEIRLVLAALGDTIAQFLDPTCSACPASIISSDG